MKTRKEIKKKKFTIYCDKAAIMVVDEKRIMLRLYG